MTHQKEQNVLNEQDVKTIAARLEGAMMSMDAGAAATLADELHRGLLDALASVDVDVKKAVRGDEDALPPLKQAYELGLLSFAQGFASQIAMDVEPPNFLKLLADSKYKKYTHALFSDDLTGVSLAEMVEETPESVSRKLKELREAGITEFRREGRTIVNFLTPIAKTTLINQGLVLPNKARQTAELIKNLGSKLEPHLRNHPNFASGAKDSEEKCYE